MYGSYLQLVTMYGSCWQLVNMYGRCLQLVWGQEVIRGILAFSQTKPSSPPESEEVRRDELTRDCLDMGGCAGNRKKPASGLPLL
jgi:hypothetical protein